MKPLAPSSALLLLLASSHAADSPLAPPLRKFDRNQDGKLTGEEVVLARQAFNRGGRDPDLSPEIWSEILSQRRKDWEKAQRQALDADRDGKLSDQEKQRRDAIWADIAQASAALRDELTRKFDRNDDGQLSDQERQPAQAESDSRRRDLEQKALAAHPWPPAPAPVPVPVPVPAAPAPVPAAPAPVPAAPAPAPAPAPAAPDAARP